jgi:hypothetical protein
MLDFRKEQPCKKEAAFNLRGVVDLMSGSIDGESLAPGDKY